MNWFNQKHININKLLKDPFNKNIKGYVLPHAGTLYSGSILSHTLQFPPLNYFKKILIIYYPANIYENVIIGKKEKYFHEFFVPMKTLDYVTKYIWKYGKKNIEGINIRNSDKNLLNNLELISDETLLIISADFSHFLPLQEAKVKENCAAHSIMHKYFSTHLQCLDIVDIKDSFELMYKIIPTNYNLQWIGRTRSPGEKGVGYLSFFIKQPQNNNNFKIPDGIFVTAYDLNMQQRECLGKWFDKNLKYNKLIENQLINKVLHNASTTSRLTKGENINIPVTHYSITYLYKTNTKKFIRGYHGIKGEEFFLPDVMLENTYNNGTWIEKNDIKWKKYKKFNIKYTLNKIKEKAKNLNKKFTRKNKKYNNNYILYYSDVVHKKI
jgi:hypothetical protein